MLLWWRVCGVHRIVAKLRVVQLFWFFLFVCLFGWFLFAHIMGRRGEEVAAKWAGKE